ncbi:YdcF family protein [Candidatus Parvarchaeota archaeon]|nr:YdcF family protein [Candidatus Parvarchaeota archaeon]
MQHLENILKEQNGTAIIILGGSNRRFRKRLEKAIEIYGNKDNSLLLIAGQNVRSDKTAMEMLEGKDFLYENKSVNTYDNAVNSFEMLRIMKAQDPFDFTNDGYGSNYRNFSDIVVVTDTLHMPRAKRYFSKVFDDSYDISFVKVPEEKTDLIHKLIYESIGYSLSFLPNECLNFAKAIKQKYFPRL